MKQHRFLAFDLGAESGRCVLGTLEGGVLSVQELHRFPNAPVAIDRHLHWDAPALFREIKTGLRLCAERGRLEIDGVAVDTWGVDFGLLDNAGRLIGLPFAYRDLRNVPAMEAFLAKFSKDRVYAITGIQFLPFNSLFQLYALALYDSGRLAAASDLLFMPDLFSYFLSGSIANEATVASTSQLLDPRGPAWSEELLGALGVPSRLFHPPVRPATVIGRLQPTVASEAGLEEIPVIATAGHDTASAVAAVPARGKNWAYISSGTWSLVGIDVPAPQITPVTLRLNFTNEGGLDGRIRLLKNVTGLWLVQQCRKAWSVERTPSYDELSAAAEAAPAFQAFIDPDHPDFLNPADMPEAIREFCRRSGQRVPAGRGEIVRCALESLALKYRMVLEELRQVSALPIETIHVIGGGSRNELLCRFTADAAWLPVVSGPVEATAAGNILVQALALGIVGSPEEIRGVVAASTNLKTYEPGNRIAWEAAYTGFREAVRRGQQRGTRRTT